MGYFSLSQKWDQQCENLLTFQFCSPEQLLGPSVPGWVMPEALLYLRQLDGVKGWQSVRAALKCRKQVFPWTSKSMPTSKNKYKADRYFRKNKWEQAKHLHLHPSSRDAGLDNKTFFSSISPLQIWYHFKRKPVHYFHLRYGEIKPLEVEWLGQSQTWLCLYWNRAISSRQKCYLWLQPPDTSQKSTRKPT